jgi:GTP cyclohydrolase I
VQEIDFAVAQIHPEWSASVRLREALEYLDIKIEGDLEETPRRWVKALVEMTEGYRQCPKEILSKRFVQPAADELVILRDITFTSLCEHHLLTFTGVAHVGYLPSGFVVGLSKLARLVDCFARRLQVQERMTHDIAHTIQRELDSSAVGVVVEAHHSCMGCRGVKKEGASMVTSALLGKLRSEASLRSEFLALIRK